MSECTVDANTTPAQLARYVSSLHPNARIYGRQVGNGDILLYARTHEASRQPDRKEASHCIAARVAVGVALGRAHNLPGAAFLLKHVHCELGSVRTPLRAGALLEPALALAAIYAGHAGDAPDRTET
ncbi:MAG: hypothetical protein ACO1N5_10750 [Noviherbaspirillum sp.]